MSQKPLSRPVSDAGRDDIALPFLVEPLSTRGRIVRLGPAIDAILKRHAYPEAIARLVGEAAALTVLLGSALKSEGSFQLQTKTDGAVSMLIVDFDAPSNLRALARFDAEKLARAGPAARVGRSARRRPSRPDDRPRRRPVASSGRDRARRTGARGRRAPVFPALRTDPDARAPRGRRDCHAGRRRIGGLAA